MKQTRTMWDMPVTVEIADVHAEQSDIDGIFEYFLHVDSVFSTFRTDSEVSRINRCGVPPRAWSAEFREVIALCDRTEKETMGYFSCRRNGEYHPLGMVKGWALHHAGQTLDAKGYRNFFVEAGGDIAIRGRNSHGEKWRVGIRSPFQREEVVKVLSLSDCGIATSGTYVRGRHIYNPVTEKTPDEIVSITVIGPNIYEADRFATAAFAMGRSGISFIEQMKNLEGYQIDRNGIATFTSGFAGFVHSYDYHQLDRPIA